MPAWKLFGVRFPGQALNSYIMDLATFFDREYSVPKITRVNSVRAICVDNHTLRGTGTVVGDSVSLRKYLARHPGAKKVRIEVEIVDCRTSRSVKKIREFTRESLKKFL